MNIKHFLLFAVFLPVQALLGQSIVTSTKQWSNTHFHYSGMSMTTEKIRFTNDTLIDGLVYKRVEQSVDEVPVNWLFYGYIMEDEHHRVYYRTQATSGDHLLYAMDLQSGDTVTVYGLMDHAQGLFYSMTYTVLTIDSFPIGDGYRKQWHMGIDAGGTYMETEQWIDSTGSKSGMLHNWNGTVGGDGFSLLCFEENGALLYQNPLYTSCYVITATEELIRKSQCTLYPNPVGDFVRIAVQQGIFQAYTITSPTGQILQSGKIPPSMMLPVDDLQPGFYFLQLMDMKGKRDTVLKMIKK